MGSGNVGLVFARWGHLPGASFRALSYMAHRSRDDDDPPKFWEGREALAFALGRETPPEPAPSDESPRALENRRRRRADFEAVKAAVRPLLRVMVIAVDQASSPRNNARYSLHLLAPTGKAQPVEQGRLTLSTGKADPVEQGRLSLPPNGPLPTGGALPGELENGIPNTNSSQASTSLAAELTYSQASEFLQKLPDLGAAYLARIPETEFATLADRVIAAAHLATQERNSA